jgi:hypothetical protein
LSTTASTSLICGSTAIMNPSAAMLGVVVKDGAITAVPPATVTGVVDGVRVK